jgi:hypothetical protein
MLVRAQAEDGTWYDLGISMGVAPWEQFPTEPRSAFNVFCVYRDAYPEQMTTKELSVATGYGTSAIRHWIDRWKWKERYFEYGRMLDKKAMVEQMDIRKDMNDRQIGVAKDLLTKAMERIEHIDVDELSPGETLKFAELAAKLERQATTDNREMVEEQIKNRSFDLGTAAKADAATQDDSLKEILAILQSAGAINIQTETTISTPKVVQEEQDNVVDTEYEETEPETGEDSEK